MPWRNCNENLPTEAKVHKVKEPRLEKSFGEGRTSTHNTYLGDKIVRHISSAAQLMYVVMMLRVQREEESTEPPTHTLGLNQRLLAEIRRAEKNESHNGSFLNKDIEQHLPLPNGLIMYSNKKSGSVLSTLTEQPTAVFNYLAR